MDDNFGYHITTTSRAAHDAWNRTVHAFLSHSAETPSHLAEVLRLDPDCTLAHACRGLFSLLLGRRELVDTARACLTKARTDGVTRREALYVHALAEWLAGWPSKAVHAIEAVLERHPEDALAMKLGHSIRFILGDLGGMRQSIERVLPAYDTDHPARGYLHGCYAFTLEESGAYRRAEREGRYALELAPDDVWGMHAVAHVYDMTARSHDGIRFINARRDGWKHCNNFRYHVWWHLALMHLDIGDTARVLSLYDEEVRAERTDDYRDIANAASLLMRLELEGINVGCRWDELSEICVRRTGDGCLAFADLHYMMAFGGAGDDDAAQTLIARIQTDAWRCSGDMESVMRFPALSAAQGLKAFRAGAFAQALSHLIAARSGLSRIGGSHAQRDIFERLAIEAAICCGEHETARGLIDARSAHRGHEDSFARTRMRLVEDALDLCASTSALHHGRLT